MPLVIGRCSEFFIDNKNKPSVSSKSQGYSVRNVLLCFIKANACFVSLFSDLRNAKVIQEFSIWKAFFKLKTSKALVSILNGQKNTSFFLVQKC